MCVRERECVCVCEWCECMHACVCVRKRECVCVCVRERGGGGLTKPVL